MQFPLILSMLNIVYNAPGSVWITFCLLALILGLIFSCGLRLSAKADFDCIISHQQRGCSALSGSHTVC